MRIHKLSLAVSCLVSGILPLNQVEIPEWRVAHRPSFQNGRFPEPASCPAAFWRVGIPAAGWRYGLHRLADVSTTSSLSHRARYFPTHF